MKKKKNLILGACRGYAFSDISLFVGSLKQTGFSGDTRLFFSALSRADRRSLRRYNVKPLFFSDVYPFGIGFGREAKKHLPQRTYAFRYFNGPLPANDGIYYQRF